MNRRHFLRTGSVLLAGAAAAPSAAAAIGSMTVQSGPAPPGAALPLAPRFGDGRDWWFQKRFGMFVHWGLYAINGLHEQEQWRRRVPRAEYVKLAAQWNPSKFAPTRGWT